MHRKKAAAQRAPKRPLSLLFSLVPSFFPCLFPFVILPTDAPTKKKERGPRHFYRGVSLSASTSCRPPPLSFSFLESSSRPCEKSSLARPFGPFFLTSSLFFLFLPFLFTGLLFFFFGPWSSPTFFFSRLGLWPCSPISLCRRCCGIHICRPPFENPHWSVPVGRQKTRLLYQKKEEKRRKRKEKAILWARVCRPEATHRPRATTTTTKIDRHGLWRTATTSTTTTTTTEKREEEKKRTGLVAAFFFLDGGHDHTHTRPSTGQRAPKHAPPTCHVDQWRKSHRKKNQKTHTTASWRARRPRVSREKKKKDTDKNNENKSPTQSTPPTRGRRKIKRGREKENKKKKKDDIVAPKKKTPFSCPHLSRFI